MIIEDIVSAVMYDESTIYALIYLDHFDYCAAIFKRLLTIGDIYNSTWTSKTFLSLWHLSICLQTRRNPSP